MIAAKAPAVRGGGRRRTHPSLAVAIVAALALLAVLSGSVARAADPVTPPSEALPPAAQRAENVIAAARQYLGVPYRVGSEGPNLFDCSGLIFRAFSDVGLVDRISGNRLRAAGYMRWFARQGLMTANVEEAQRGDLVVYDRGKHIGIYLGEGRTLSALVTGVTVHSLNGISQEVTGFLRPDWSGAGEVPPFVPIDLPDIPEEPAVLVPAAEWMPALDETTVTPIEREGAERTDLRTLNSRTFENADGTFTTEFHAQPIHYLPAEGEELAPIDLHFAADERDGSAVVATSPVVVSARAADSVDGLVSAAAGEQLVTLGLIGSSAVAPTIAADGAAVDYFDLIADGVGLRLLARPDGFKSFVVFAQQPDTNRISFVLDAPGLVGAIDELSGDVLLADEAGTVVARLPRPLLLDSSDDDGLGGGLFSAAGAYELTTDRDGRTVLTVTIRERFLEEAVYPAYLDLSLTEFPATAAAADVTFVSSRHADSSLAGYQRPDSAGLSELWLGHQPRSRNDNEVYIRFNELAATLGTVDVATASLELLPYWQRADDVAALVRRVAGEWSAHALTWNTRPVTDVDLGELAGTAGQWTALDLSGYVTDILSRGATDFGLMLYGAEDATGTWKRLVAGAGAGSPELGPRLVVTWSGLRPSPAVAPAVAPDIEHVPEAELTDPNALAPFAWTLPEIAPEQTRYEVQVSADGFATVSSGSGVIKGRLGKAMEWALPADALSTSGDYAWRVRVRFGDQGWSEWSVAQPFSWQSAVAPFVPAPAVVETI